MITATDERILHPLGPELRKFYPATSKDKDEAMGEERSRFKGSCLRKERSRFASTSPDDPQDHPRPLLRMNNVTPQT